MCHLKLPTDIGYFELTNKRYWPLAGLANIKYQTYKPMFWCVDDERWKTAMSNANVGRPR